MLNKMIRIIGGKLMGGSRLKEDRSHIRARRAAGKRQRQARKIQRRIARGIR